MVCKAEGLTVYHNIEHHYPGNAEGSVPKKYLIAARAMVCLCTVDKSHGKNGKN